MAQVFVCGVGRDTPPTDSVSDRRGAEAASSLTAVQGPVLCPRAFGLLLPGAPEHPECLLDLVRANPVAVVNDTDLLDAVELVPDQLYLDLVGVGIEGVPDQ